MSETEMTPATDTRSSSRRGTTALVLVAVLFGALYAIDIWQAADNLLSLPAVYDAVAEVLGTEPATPWAWLVVGVALPPVAFAGAFVVARRRPVWQLALALLVGWCAVNALTLSTEIFLF